MRKITRDEWNSLNLLTAPVEIKTTVTETVAIETESVDLYAAVCEDGVDVRVGDLQLIVKGQGVVLVQRHPPYPIEEWTVLWEGKLV